MRISVFDDLSRLVWLSIAAPFVAASFWLVNLFPKVMHAANGYAGLMIAVFLYGITPIICGAGIVFGVMSLFSKNREIGLSVIGIVLNVIAVGLLMRFYS